MITPEEHPANEDKPNGDAALDRLLAKLRSYQTSDLLHFGEAYDLLDEIDMTLDSMKGHPDAHRGLSDVRRTLVVRLDARARELGETEKWEALKKERSKLHAMDKLLGAKEGMEFFDTFRELSPEQRDMLENDFDFQEVRKHELLADAARQDSVPQMLLALFRTHPFEAIELIVRYFWPTLLFLFCGTVLLWQGYRIAAALTLIVSLIYAARVVRGAKKRAGPAA